jgi:phospholipase C
MVSEAKLRTCSVVALASALLIMCGCQGLQPSNGTGGGKGSITSVNHIIFMAQENRSFDTYFGQLPSYWKANGYSAQQFEGLPAGASNPSFDGTSSISAFHIATECTENLSPSWNESHQDWNRHSPTSGKAMMDGFVFNAAKFAKDNGLTDTAGIRAMGYYDDRDLNYYYFMASNFGTSDHWFSPVMDRTQVNRMYLLAATSQGYAYPIATNAADSAPLTVPTIFDALQKAAVSWKIYATDIDPNTNEYATALTMFQPYIPPAKLPPNVVSATQFVTDAQNGTLPAVALLEGGYNSGLDEHPSNGTNVQAGAGYVAGLINGLMASVSWRDSAFILTYDEAGGLYDHVPPLATVNPDGMAPKDLQPGDICTATGGSNCDFNYTGFRVPLIVISPFAKKNYVSHTPADYTAILKFIEKRFLNGTSLTLRDAAQIDMTEFFDFQGVPWATAPTPPVQAINGACNAQTLR